MTRKKKELNRSVRLRKYETAYNECVKKQSHSPTQTLRKPVSKKKTYTSIVRRKPSRSRSVHTTKNKVKVKKKPLTAYQKFYKKENKKKKYTGMTGRERMSMISTEWKRQKDYT